MYRTMLADMDWFPLERKREKRGIIISHMHIQNQPSGFTIFFNQRGISIGRSLMREAEDERNEKNRPLAER